MKIKESKMCKFRPFFSMFVCLVAFSVKVVGAESHTYQDQRKQLDYDEEYFEINEGFEKLRHILLHLMKSTGKIAAYCEIKEHGREVSETQLLDEALPDLYMHALQIANLFELDLGAKYEERIASNIARFGGVSK
ncbi:MAG: hypothetical protein H7A40_01390 [Chlamydiales bacterium]|nr:hypothetical protein [Chlamydiales bacterium]